MLTSRFDEALAYAVAAHAGQTRKKSEIPYISHLLIVAGTALEYGANEDEAIAALLHDAVEDAGGQARATDIRTRFGDRVAAIVLGCSHADTVPKPESSARKREHLDRLRSERDPSVLFVCACDKLANVRSILKDHRALGDDVFGKFNVGKDETLAYYREFVDVLNTHATLPIVEELSRAVAELIARAGSEVSSDAGLHGR
jgi:(p)ppGpp synthase/HD superfamily hydrolase